MKCVELVHTAIETCKEAAGRFVRAEAEGELLVTE